jgi:nucleotide-binding universal stress UspA family protein
MDAQRNRRAVVVGVDGSGHALRAVRWAAAEATRRGAPLRMVNAFGAAPERLPHTIDATHYQDAAHRTARDMVADAARAVLARDPGVVVEQRTFAGSAIEVLRAESASAQLLVVGDRGLSRLEGLLAGSVAVAMTTTAACPVVVVHAGETDPPTEDPRPVVIGVDGSATSEAATEFAFAAATTRGVPLIAVHTWWDPIAGPALAPVLDLDAIDADAREQLLHRLAGWREKYPEVEVATSVGRDHPAHALLQHAARAQLLVVGSRGRGELGGLVLGSVSNAVVHRSLCPVAVIRPDASGRV